MKNKIKKCFVNAHGELRNGVWVALFIALIAASRPLFSIVNKAIENSEMSKLWVEPLPFLFILVITFFCLKLRKEPLSNVGLKLNKRFFTLLALGSLIGAMQITLVVLCIWLIGGVELNLNTALDSKILLISLYSMVFAVLMEELLFRGFLFQRVIDGLGFLWAQIIFAILFAVGHISDPELSTSAMFWAGLDIALGSMLFGLAYMRTKSLALPIGLHFGWNWFQGDVLGFAVSGQSAEGILVVSTQTSPSWLNGGAYGPEATIFAVLSEIVLIFLLWRWKGTQA